LKNRIRSRPCALCKRSEASFNKRPLHTIQAKWFVPRIFEALPAGAFCLAKKEGPEAPYSVVPNRGKLGSLSALTGSCFPDVGRLLFKNDHFVPLSRTEPFGPRGLDALPSGAFCLSKSRGWGVLKHHGIRRDRTAGYRHSAQP
jgi:hypothetical protein